MASFLDFDLRLSFTQDKITIQVVNSPFGQFEYYSPSNLPDLLYFADTDTLRKYGEVLFNAVFNGEILALWRRCQDKAAAQEKRLRLLLRFAPDTPQEFLPWETLYDPVMGEYLALQSQTGLLRYLEVPQAPRPLPVAYPLRILAILANPSDMPILNVESEWQALQTVLAPLIEKNLVQVERLLPPTPDNLQHKLRQATFHILHFVGHGGFDEAKSEGFLLLSNEENLSRRVYAQHWSMLLGESRRNLGLVILNACQTSRANLARPFGGVAQALVRLGIPALIANQSPMTDQAALVLSKELYLALAEGLPVDRALSEARKAVFNAGFELEWTIPTLFLRSESDGLVFQIQKLNLDKVLQTLQKALPSNDATPQQLAQVFEQFQQFHTRLFEWKELHNYINEVLFQVSQFAREVERLDASGGMANPRNLQRLWRPVSQKVTLLLGWAGGVKSIAPQPFTVTPEGIQGPRWAVELHEAQLNLEESLRVEPMAFSDVYDASFVFVDVAERQMYLADKELRAAAGELYQLSRLILGH